jgi:hypothetical protein
VQLWWKVFLAVVRPFTLYLELVQIMHEPQMCRKNPPTQKHLLSASILALISPPFKRSTFCGFASFHCRYGLQLKIATAISCVVMI